MLSRPRFAIFFFKDVQVWDRQERALLTWEEHAVLGEGILPISERISYSRFRQEKDGLVDKLDWPLIKDEGSYLTAEALTAYRYAVGVPEIVWLTMPEEFRIQWPASVDLWPHFKGQALTKESSQQVPLEQIQWLQLK